MVYQKNNTYHGRSALYSFRVTQIRTTYHFPI